MVNEEKPAGSYAVEFQADKFPSGVYFYKLQAGNFSQVKKMILLR
ncbi:MAG TPA: T9SS type A sorting domain-containing protein [Ignavibacteriaceae bacterium]